MKMFVVMPPEGPIFELDAENAREARAWARFLMGVEKLPKGTLVVEIV